MYAVLNVRFRSHCPDASDRGLTLLSPFSHSPPSLIGLLASVDVKQQKLTNSISVSLSGHN